MSSGPGLSYMSSMAFQMYQVVVEMCQVGISFDLVFLALVRFKYISKKRAPLLSTTRLKGTSVSGRGKLLVLGIPRHQHASAVYPCMRGRKAFIFAPASEAPR